MATIATPFAGRTETLRVSPSALNEKFYFFFIDKNLANLYNHNEVFLNLLINSQHPIAINFIEGLNKPKYEIQPREKIELKKDEIQKLIIGSLSDQSHNIQKNCMITTVAFEFEEQINNRIPRGYENRIY